jgi:alkane 1-monooxygenase
MRGIILVAFEASLHPDVADTAPNAAPSPAASASRYRFAAAWTFPLAVMGAALLVSPWAAWATAFGYQVLLALAERVPGWARSPAAAPMGAWHRFCLRVHVPIQAVVLGLALSLVATGGFTPGAVVALGIGVGAITGSLGITYAHELGHSRSRFDRVLGWLLMASVNYAHFMVEHYRGHHPRAATFDDPASARRGESLWRFLPRTLVGSLASAWRLEARQLAQLGRGWHASPLAWATLAQAAVLVLLGATLGAPAVLFWLVQSAYAVFLLEAINYIEHYGLERSQVAGRREPFGVMHAWNADHVVTNSLLVNLQRHSDHHMHAWKPFAELEPLPGPQLPTGYAGCLFLASVPPLWFRLMHRRLAAMAPAAATA